MQPVAPGVSLAEVNAERCAAGVALQGLVDKIAMLQRVSEKKVRGLERELSFFVARQLLGAFRLLLLPTC